MSETPEICVTANQNLMNVTEGMLYDINYSVTPLLEMAESCECVTGSPCLPNVLVGKTACLAQGQNASNNNVAVDPHQLPAWKAEVELFAKLLLRLLELFFPPVLSLHASTREKEILMLPSGFTSPEKHYLWSNALMFKKWNVEKSYKRERSFGVKRFINTVQLHTFP